MVCLAGRAPSRCSALRLPEGFRHASTPEGRRTLGGFRLNPVRRLVGLYWATGAGTSTGTAGLAPSTISASGVSQWLFTQPVLRCSTGPAVPPSVNRSVMRAGAPHCGQAMGSSMTRLLVREDADAHDYPGPAGGRHRGMLGVPPRPLGS